MSLHEVSTLIGTTSFSEPDAGTSTVEVGTTTGSTTGVAEASAFEALVLGALVFGALLAIYTYNYDIFLYSFWP
jgi:hypothetical protein